jgi:urea-proton symporter
MATALPQSYGYGIVVGVGLAFSITMIATTYCLRRYQKEIITSEEFSTAGRSVKTGLIAAAVVSSWTWAATLLQATSQAYKNGVSGPFWYASGATVQIILFATVAIELKKKAPGAHTYLEIIKERYGTVAHVIYMVFAIATNILVTAMLITGGSAVVNDLTGMPVAAACLLLPLGVMIYTLFGGIKATFLTDYVHSVILLVIIIIFVFTVYATSPYLGSPGVVYDLLSKLA